MGFTDKAPGYHACVEAISVKNKNKNLGKPTDISGHSSQGEGEDFIH